MLKLPNDLFSEIKRGCCDYSYPKRKTSQGLRNNRRTKISMFVRIISTVFRLLFDVCLNPIIFLVDCNTKKKKKTIRVSDEEVSAKVRNSSLFSLNVWNRDASIPVRYSLRTVTP